MAGRQKESEQFKAAFAAYKSLPENEKTAFRIKAFTLLLNGLPEDIRKEFWKQRDELCNSVKAKLELQVKIDGLKDIPEDILKAALASRKASK